MMSQTDIQSALKSPEVKAKIERNLARVFRVFQHEQVKKVKENLPILDAIEKILLKCKEEKDKSNTPVLQTLHSQLSILSKDHQIKFIEPHKIIIDGVIGFNLETKSCFLLNEGNRTRITYAHLYTARNPYCSTADFSQALQQGQSTWGNSKDHPASHVHFYSSSTKPSLRIERELHTFGLVDWALLSRSSSLKTPPKDDRPMLDCRAGNRSSEFYYEPPKSKL